MCPESDDRPAWPCRRQDVLAWRRWILAVTYEELAVGDRAGRAGSVKLRCRTPLSSPGPCSCARDGGFVIMIVLASGGSLTRSRLGDRSRPAPGFGSVASSSPASRPGPWRVAY